MSQRWEASLQHLLTWKIVSWATVLRDKTPAQGPLEENMTTGVEEVEQKLYDKASIHALRVSRQADGRRL